MEATVFNPIQVHLLKMFEIDKSQKGFGGIEESVVQLLFFKDEECP